MEQMSVVLSVTLALIVAALAAFALAAFEALLKGCFELRRSLGATSRDLDSELLKSPIVPGVSVICVPPDSSPRSRALVRRLLDLHFGKHEVVLVLDGPSQPERDCWVREFRLSPKERALPEDLPAAAIRQCYLSRDPIRLLAIDKEPGGVADALNAGVNAAQYPLIGLVDREAEFIPELLLRLIRPMLGDWDRTVAVCAVAPPLPAPGLAGSIGALESLRLWLARCAAFSAWNKLLPVPGASVLVKRDAVLSVGGFRTGPMGLFLDLHAAALANSSQWRIAFLSSPVSFRPAACTWQDLRRHALDEQQQLRSSLGRFGPGAGREFFGLFCIRGLRPLFETAGYVLAAGGWIAGLVHPALASLVFLMGAGTGIATSMAAVVLRERAQPGGMAPLPLALLFLASIPESLGYRQIRNLWLIAGLFGSSALQKQNRGQSVQDRAPAMETSKSQ